MAADEAWAGDAWVADTPAVTPEPLAHLTAEGRPHLLLDHLTGVGAGAARFADAFGAASFARLAGRWHDLGKHSVTFQHMIRAANGFEAHLEGDPGDRGTTPPRAPSTRPTC